MTENRAITILSIVGLFCIYLLDFFTLFFSKNGNVFFFEIGNLTIPSLVLFILVLIIGTVNTRAYFLLLFFVLLAFPSPIDDIFPSVPITSLTDRKQVLFPFITRIDIYLWLGIIKGAINHGFKIKDFRLNTILKFLLLLFPFVILVNLFQSENLWYANLILTYSFQYRYLILVLILISYFDLKQYQKQLIYGLLFSLVFLLIEATVNTYMIKSPRLLSGSLSLNTFANISAAIGLYFFYLLRFGLVKKTLGLIVMLLSLFIVIKTGTRSALILYFLAYLLIYLFSNKKQLILNTIKIGFAVVIIVGLYVLGSDKNYVPERYAYATIVERITINYEGTLLSEKIQIAISKETNSLRTRLDLFDTSIQMASKNPISGVGPGLWNLLKNEYKPKGKFPNVLLDSHNDYLAMVAQYGFILTIFLSLFVFYTPFKNFHKIKGKLEPIHFLFVINFAMGIAAWSNAGFFKHQIAAVLVFSSCCLLNLSKVQNEANF
ncbi:hypothetical protein GCM10011414_05430 [Croceivirga lutea]|uniref:O-antigen ligase family protein n=1 Tax=Croceivirga lutea TaxID=1775167 RepID=UPI00163A20C3|nr:O-antigen ligase family protein [Croceivirga lutea]GGG39009.1 hypothetical protein GCM10011414_05430 [Croceivirga lutea]